jgi:hypothetical protein
MHVFFFFAYNESRKAIKGGCADMSFTKFYFRPGQGEQIETTISLRHDSRCVIHGHVKDVTGEPFADAAVLLFEMPERGEPKLVSQMFTDEFGQFVFGPLEAGQLYMAKVFKNTVNVREIENGD